MIKILNKQDEVVCVLQNDNSQESCPYWDDIAHDKLNDSYSTYEFKAPANHEYSQFLIEENKAAIDDLDGITRIYRIKVAQDEGTGDSKSRYIFAENEALEMLGTWLRPQNLAGKTAKEALDIILADTRWEPGIIEWSGIRSVNFENYVTAIEAIHTTRSQWSSDLRYRAEIKNNKVTGRFVDLPEMVGRDDGKRFEYGKDLVGMTRRISTEELATAMIGVGASNDDKTFVTIAPASWSENTGDPANKPAGQDWIADEAALSKWGNDGRHIFGIYRDENEKDPEALLTKTWNDLQKRKEPRITFEAEVALLMRLIGFNFERVGLGDSIRIKDNTYDPPIILAARIIEHKWSQSDPEQDSVVIGDYRPQLTTTYALIQNLQNTIQVNAGIWNAETKTYTSDTPPANPEPDTIWLDTSGEVDVYKRWDDASGTWIPATPTDLATSQDVQAVRTYAEKTRTTGLAMIRNASTFSTEGSNPGELYFHGFDANGDPADIDGWILIDGYKQIITKGMLNPNNLVENGYIMYDTTDNFFYLVLVDSAGKWIRYNASEGAQHMTYFTPGPQHYFVGYVEMDGPENFTHSILWQQPRDYAEIIRLGVIPNIETTVDTAAADAAAAKSTAESANTTAGQAQSAAETANTTAGTAKSTAESAASTANTANQTANTANQTATSANNTANTAKQTADNAWGKFSGAGNTLPSGNVEFNFAASTSKGGNALNTDKVGTETAANVQNTSLNFNKRNDRKSTAPAAPTVLIDGTAIDHTINKDGSADISFEWGFTGTGDAYDIDGFIIYIRAQSAATAYTFGTMPGDEQVFYVTPEKRAFLLYGTAADKYYTFGVQAYRLVDNDINAAGVLKSAIVKSTLAAENPYRPSSTVAFAGSITGTINGLTPAQVTAQEQNAKDAVQNGQVTLPTGMLSGDINPDQNAIISPNSQITWSSQGIVVSDPTGTQQVSSMTKEGFNSLNGAFTLEDENTGQKYSLEMKQNLIHDHSFELLQAGAPIAGANGYYDITQSSESGSEDNWERWWSVGARLKSVYNTDSQITSPFGHQSVAVNNAGYIRQSIDITEGRTFTISGHFFAPSFSQGATGMPRLQVDFLKTVETSPGVETTTNLGNFVFDGGKPTVDYLTPERIALTVTAPPVGATTGLLHYRMRITIIGQNAYWVEADGIQVVENDKPVQYQPENELWALRRGSSGGKTFVPFIDAPEKNAAFGTVKTLSKMYMQGEGEVGNLIGDTTAFFGFYPVGANGGRKAWFGYGSATLAFKLFSYHDIEFQPNGGSNKFVFDQVTNGGLNFGQSKLKFTAASAALQSRNAADTAFGTFQASNVALSSLRDFKRLITRSQKKALDIIEQTPVYEYKLEEEFKIYDEENPEQVVGEKPPEEVKTRIGLILEEAPEEIVEDDQTISMYDMLTLSWKGLQEQIALNKVQSLQLANQRKLIDGLTARLDALETKVNGMQPPAK